MTYLGSKVKYAKYICPILQKRIDETGKDFLDVCVGGANIIKNIKAPARVGVDNNKYVIALWRALQDPEFEFPSYPTRADWDGCKENPEKYEDWFVGLVSVFCSYNTRGFAGGYISGKEGEKQYNGRINTVKKDLPLIKGVLFYSGDYSDIPLEIAGTSIIYVDPPYKNTKKYDTSKNFDYDRFWNWVRDMSVYTDVYVSEQQAPEDFIPVWSLKTSRRIAGIEAECVENLWVKAK